MSGFYICSELVFQSKSNYVFIRSREAVREVAAGTLCRTGNGWSIAGPWIATESWTDPRILGCP